MTHHAPPETGVSVRFDHCEAAVVGRSDETVLDLARRHGVAIASVCGGRGICKSCIVRFTSAAAPAPSEADRHFFSPGKLARGWRRACQCAPVADCAVRVPARGRAEAVRVFSEGGDIWVEPEPAVAAFDLALDAPGLADSRADAERLLAAVEAQAPGAARSVDIGVLRLLPDVLRAEAWRVRAVVRAGEVVAVLPRKGRILGLAVDLGTTNIALLLVDLSTGNTLAAAGIANPQGVYGGDIVARLTAVRRQRARLDEMRRLVVDAINREAAALCAGRGLLPQAIVDVTVAGNTAMHHIFAGLPTDQLGLSPFTATARATDDVKARDLGLAAAPGACVHLMHTVAGFVGGDHTAMLLGIRADEETRTVVALDIGTNTEISLIHQGRITSLSCPSGPALEGGNISHGMRAATGAIEKVAVRAGKIEIAVIGGGVPAGLCGSAVLDAVAAFARAGAISRRGQIDTASPFACEEDGHPALMIAAGEDHPVTFTQQDVRNVQLAKGSIRAGIEMLLRDAGLTAGDVDRIVVAGAFGLYIDLGSAIAIGMLPDLPRERYEQIGNAAGMGAKLALVSQRLRQAAIRLAAASRYIEQAGSPDFMRCFMDNINLPDTDRDR